MPNPNPRANLKPNSKRTPEQLKAMGAKGGKASGETRKRRKTARELAKMVLGLNVTTTAKTKKALKKLGYDTDAEGAPSVELLMQIAIANQAMAGDLASAKFLYDYAQVPDIHTAIERERIKATADARQKVDVNVNTADADCIAEIRQRMNDFNEQGAGNADIERPENSPVDCFQRDGAGRPEEQGTGIAPPSIPHSAFPIPHSTP